MTFRLFPTLLLSGGITFSLFWVMTALIAVPDVLEIEPDLLPTIDLVDVRLEQPPIPEPEERPKREEIEPQPLTPTQPFEPGEGLRVIAHSKPLPGDLVEAKPTLGVAVDGDAIPLVRVPPRYPERAMARGVEGRVLIGFTIDPTGNVRSPEVLAAEPPNVFDRAAIEAVSQWKYNPQVRNGRPVERPGMKIAIPFRLGEHEAR
ncbi:MAG: energy transducer TonB [bacterium]|nr:energy transducer TonB [bacterium]